MKKLLLLFIPLMFFFGCEEESSVTYICTVEGCIEPEVGQYSEWTNLTLEDCLNICDCSCGEIIEEVTVPAFSGYLVDNGSGEFIQVGAYPSYTLFNVQNYCTKNIGIAYGNLNVGQTHCMEYQWQMSECSWMVFDPGSGGLVTVSEPILTDCSLLAGFSSDNNWSDVANITLGESGLLCDCEPIPF